MREEEKEIEEIEEFGNKNTEDLELEDISDLIVEKKTKMSEEKEHSYISESHCLWCKGFSEGIDADWDWVRVALIKMVDKEEIKDTFILKLHRIIEDTSIEEFKEITKDWTD